MHVETRTLVVFPTTLFTALASTINLHRDNREIAVNLYGVLCRIRDATVIIPYGIIGTGIERVRHVAACNVDYRSRFAALDGISASHEFTPTRTWAEVGNHHRHPVGYNVPSPGDVRSAVSFLSDLRQLPFYVMGIFHRQPGGMDLSVFSIDRRGECTRILWTCLDLPSFADPNETTDEVWTSQPMRIATLTQALAARGVFAPFSYDRDGGLRLTANAGVTYRIAPGTRGVP